MVFGSGDEKRRKPFSLSQKRIEWLLSAGHDPEGKFYQTSRCRKCKIRLVWGDRSYDFDHKDNNPANNSQRNCFLVCKNCHGKATKVDKVRVREPWLGMTVGHRTIKRKVSYKKPKAKPKKTKSKRRTSERGPLWPWL